MVTVLLYYFGCLGIAAVVTGISYLVIPPRPSRLEFFKSIFGAYPAEPRLPAELPAESDAQMILKVPYEYLTALEVDELKQRTVKNKAWEWLKWGSFGPDGHEHQKVRVLNDLGTDHLEAILITQPQIGRLYRAAILELLKVRKVI